MGGLDQLLYALMTPLGEQWDREKNLKDLEDQITRMQGGDGLIGQQYQKPSTEGPYPDELAAMRGQLMQSAQPSTLPKPEYEKESIFPQMPEALNEDDYSRTGMDLSPEERKRLIEERMLGYQSDIRGMDLNPQMTQRGERLLGFGKNLFGIGEDSVSQSLADRTAPKSGAVQQVIDARKSAQEAAETERMQDDAMQRSLDPMSWVQQTDASPLGPEEKLRKIAAEAKAMGGGQGISVPGGSYSEMTDDPEARARIAAMNEWAGGQTERNLEYATTPEQARRNPEYAISAADKLAGLQKSGAVEQQVANQKLLIDEYAKQGGGKIPSEMANKFDVAGFDIPWAMRGMSPEQADAWLDQQDQAIAGDIEGLMGGGPENVMGWAVYVRSVIATAKKRIAGGENRDVVIAWVKEQTQKSGDESGATEYAQQMLAAQEGN